MALISPNGILGLSGIQAGQQINQNQFNLNAQARALLTQDFEQNILAQLQGFGQGQQLGPDGQPQRGANPLSFGAALAQSSQSTPFANLGLSRAASAIGLQQALAPQAIGAANQGQFGQLNELAGFFGQPGNFNAQNFNAINAAPLAGVGGLSALLSTQQSQPFNNLLLENLGRAQSQSGPAPLFGSSASSSATTTSGSDRDLSFRTPTGGAFSF